MELKNSEIHDESRQGEALDFKSGDSIIGTKKLYLESYGCQMNFSDSEVVASILKSEGYETTRNADEADVVFLNTIMYNNFQILDHDKLYNDMYQFDPDAKYYFPSQWFGPNGVKDYDIWDLVPKTNSKYNAINL